MRKAISLLCASAVCCLASNLRLVENGKSDYSIVIAADTSQSERHGAEELQKFLEQMSGARLPITTDPRRRMVLVGNSAALENLNLRIPFADLGPEGFALKTSGHNVVIAGGRLRGSMYGVYTFLEKLGCRWFTPELSRIPKTRTITVGPLDRHWAARNKTNGSYQRLDASVGGNVQYYPFVHSFDLLLPPSRYFDQHPEYFSATDSQ